MLSTRSVLIIMAFSCLLGTTQEAVAFGNCTVILRNSSTITGQGSRVACPLFAEDVFQFSHSGNATTRTQGGSAVPGWITARQIDVGTSLTELPTNPQVDVATLVTACVITGPEATVDTSMNIEIALEGAISRLGESHMPGAMSLKVNALFGGSPAITIIGERKILSTTDPLIPFSTTGTGIFDETSFPTSGGSFRVPKQKFVSSVGTFATNVNFTFSLRIRLSNVLPNQDVTNFTSVSDAVVSFPTDGSPVLNLPSGYTLNCTNGPVVENVFVGSPAPLASLCGNGMVDPPENCDDGGTASGDGCSDVCQVETSYECAGAPSVCTPIVVVPGTTLAGEVLLGGLLALLGYIAYRRRPQPC